MKKYIKYIAVAALFILLCISVSITRRNSETLYDYALREPETAYAEHVTGTAASPGPATTDTESIRMTKTTVEATGEEETEEQMAQTDTMYPDRIVYQPDFYYEPLSDDLKQRITGLSYKEDCPLPYDDLRHVSVLYVNFKGNTSTGDIICNKAIAQALVEISYELYQADYQIEQIRLIDEYGADDLLSMQDNNTSCFNYRTIAGTNKISMHGQGLSIDMNPFFNPYITYKNGRQQVSPAGAESYADRSQPFAYKIDENDLCYKLFMEHGFSWGGNWNHSKDYQHFEKKAEE